MLIYQTFMKVFLCDLAFIIYNVICTFFHQPLLHQTLILNIPYIIIFLSIQLINDLHNQLMKQYVLHYMFRLKRVWIKFFVTTFFFFAFQHKSSISCYKERRRKIKNYLRYNRLHINYKVVFLYICWVLHNLERYLALFMLRISHVKS